MAEPAIFVVVYERTAGDGKGKKRESQPLTQSGVFNLVYANQPLKIHAIRLA